MQKAESIIERRRRHHVFRAFRFPLRFSIGLVFVGFVAVDYIYIPHFWTEGLLLRLAWLVTVCIGFKALTLRKIRDRYSDLIAASILIMACWIIDWMIFRSGGYLSLYLIGLILVNMTGLQLIGFSRNYAFWVNVISYFPTFVIIWGTAGIDRFREALVESAFLAGMTILAWLYEAIGNENILSWALMQIRITDEVQALRRTEYLKRHFPAYLREKIESGSSAIPTKKIFSSAVLGFADICSSTSIGNSVDISTDWELKERFLEAAVKRATENGLIVLSQLGDGCFFLANYEGGDNWPLNVIAFFENLLIDFEAIRVELKLNSSLWNTGIKFGLSMGPAMVGFMGKDQPYFTANGPDANLAARLCSEAEHDEMIVSSRVWSILKQHIGGWNIEEKIYKNLKGFNEPVSAVQIRPRLKREKDRPTCATCGATLIVVSMKNSLLEVKCTNGHFGEAAGVEFTRKAA